MPMAKQYFGFRLALGIAVTRRSLGRPKNAAWLGKLCCQLDYVARDLILSIWIRQFDSSNFIEFHFILLIPLPSAFFSYSA